MVEVKRVGVHIITRNRFGALACLLTSLRNQTHKGWDLSVGDNSDVDYRPQEDILNRLVNRLKCDGHYVNIFRDNINQGVGKLRNELMKKEPNEAVLVLDDDMILEPDFIERLLKLINKSEEVGMTGGIVPPLPMADVKRDASLKKVFNESIFDTDGNITKFSDDGGYQYLNNKVLPSHHIRCAYMVRKKAHELAKGFPIEYGRNGFRSETDYCFRIIWNNFLLLTDTSAVAWHNTSGVGGADRTPADMNQTMILDNYFRTKMKYYYKKNGDPLTKEYYERCMKLI